MAHRLRTKPDRVVLAGLIALALLALGEQAPAAFPVRVSIEVHAASVQVTVDGQVHRLSSAVGGGFQSIALEQPGPLQREYQIDGSDTTSTSDRQPEVIRSLLDTPLYALDAFLRDEGSYSRWANVRVTDLSTGAVVPPEDVTDLSPGAVVPPDRVTDLAEGVAVSTDRVTDLSTGAVVPLEDVSNGVAVSAEGGTNASAGVAGPSVGLSSGEAVRTERSLPADFRVDAELQRPEAPARLWLVAAPDRREGLELDRDRRNARWLIRRGQGLDALPRWFFPEQPAPFAAELLWLLGRSVALAYALALAALALSRLAPQALSRLARLALGRLTRQAPGRLTPQASVRLRTELSEASSPPRDVLRQEDLSPQRGEPPSGGGEARQEVLPPQCGLLPSGSGALAGAGGGWLEVGVGLAALACWLAAAALVSIKEFQQLPHILDAVSYTFQAGLFVSGQLSQSAPPILDAFKGPFTVLLQGRLFTQYPPGAPAIYALGSAVNLEWLIGPAACAALIGATAWAARTVFGLAEGLAVLALGIISPFILFQSGSYLSHPVAAGLLAAALATFIAGEFQTSVRWFAVCGALLGAAFVAREIASVLFALPLGVRLLTTRRWKALGYVVAFGLPFVVAYLVYNLRQTGNALLLPRMIFDASDHFGFGDGVGFHTRHTLAAGLANTDELLTILQFDAFGWPPLFLFGLIALPFLPLRSARRNADAAWDLLALFGLLAFVVAYVGYFYHGIALGPRYYFEAMPWLLLLAARGAAALAELACSWLVPVALLGLLSLNTFLFYLPAELARREDISGLPGAPPLVLTFVEATLFGPHLNGIPDHALVLTSDWWIYNTALAPLNCARVPDCNILFALAPTADDAARLHNQFPDRTALRAERNGDELSIVPFEPQ